MKSVFCGMDYVIGVDRERRMFGKGDNAYGQLCRGQGGVVNQMVALDISLKE
jgi:alpha-tubulin suppressor-like RCC1 family protein